MRKKITRILAVILILAICFTSTAMASSKASNYIFYYNAYATGGNGAGTVKVTFTITGTSRMTSIGSTVIEIKNSSGMVVETIEYTEPKYSNMMGYDKTLHKSSVIYYGTPNVDYYAVIYFRAANSSGSDTADCATSVVTA